MSKDEDTLGTRISRARKAAGLSQQAVADACKISRNAVSLWESDTNTPQLANLETFAKMAGIRIDDLVRGVQYAPTESTPQVNQLAAMAYSAVDPDMQAVIDALHGAMARKSLDKKVLADLKGIIDRLGPAPTTDMATTEDAAGLNTMIGKLSSLLGDQTDLTDSSSKNDKS